MTRPTESAQSTWLNFRVVVIVFRAVAHQTANIGAVIPVGSTNPRKVTELIGINILGFARDLRVVLTSRHVSFLWLRFDADELDFLTAFLRALTLDNRLN